MYPSPKLTVGRTFTLARQHAGTFLGGTVLMAIVLTVVGLLTVAAFIAMIAPASQLIVPPGSPVERILALAPLGQFPGASLFLLFGPLVLGLAGMYLKAYYYALGVEPERGFASLLGRSFGLMLPLIAISFWVFIRAYLWLPMLLGMAFGMLQALGLPQAVSGLLSGPVMLLNVVLGLWLIPRLMFAPVLYIKENLGVWGSVEASLRRTEGKWGVIILNVLPLAFVAMLIGGVVGALTVAFFQSVSISLQLPVIVLMLFVLVFIYLLIMGLANLFVVVLGLAVTAENPQGTPVEAPAVVGEA